MSLYKHSRSFFVGSLACLLLAVASAVPSPVRAADTDFATWLAEFRKEAMGLGISKATLDAALGDVIPHERVIELDRSQPEFKLTFDEYLTKFISDWRR
ncbi:MAG: lytic murein transglycosylase, partial [Pseudomonadota bacterium]|nr:lytic murein transglycosylase [Pseudomonadota bacterium]